MRTAPARGSGLGTARIVLALAAGSLWAGCSSDHGILTPNQAPNTRISAGPPEGSPTSFKVNLFWFGWDDDGFIDHYDVAFDDTTHWQGPVFGNDSLFIMQASESCCVSPLPDYIPPLPDSVYEQFHTFYVRSVDNHGEADPTPAFRSFNAKTIAPYTAITFGPAELGPWGTDVQFKWLGKDDDGVVVAYRYALASLKDYVRDGGSLADPATRIIAWLDTIQYFPNFSGGYFADSAVWHFTENDSVDFPSVSTTQDPVFPDKILFAVRAIDNAGAEEKVLTRVSNTRFFRVLSFLDGPCITINSNILGTWNCNDPPSIRECFAGQGIQFTWRAVPGPSAAPIAGFGYAIDDTSQWLPYSITRTQFPEPVQGGTQEFWFPADGPHTFFVRAIDDGGFLKVLAAKLRVFQGPRFCPLGNRYILVVLDTQPSSLTGSTYNIWPANYRDVERQLVQYWFQGYNFQIHETRGTDKPTLSLMDCASSIFWLISTDMASGDTSVLKTYHAVPPNPLPSYVAAGGNLMICGLQPVYATRYEQSAETGITSLMVNFPLRFVDTTTDTTLVPHWMATQFGIGIVNDSVGDTIIGRPDKRLGLLRSHITSGANPYPDLPFDPLTWPQGPIQRGFGFYDRGFLPLASPHPAEVIYTADQSNDAIAVRRLTEPGVNGNLVFAGFHPYFVDRPAFRQFIRAVLTDFGESPTP